MNFAAGNETRDKICSDFVAEQNEWSEKRVVSLFWSKRVLVILLFSREREIEV